MDAPLYNTFSEQPAQNGNESTNPQESQPEPPAETLPGPVDQPAVSSAPPVKITRGTSWFSWIQLILSGLTILLTGALSVLNAAFGLLALVDDSAIPEQATTNFMSSTGLLLGTLLVVPSAFYSLARLRGWDVRLPGWLNALLWPFRHAWSLIIIAPLMILLGWLVTTQTDLSWLLLPGIHIVAAGIPILFLVYLGTRGKNTGSPQRKWGAVGAGLVLGPLLAMILEITVMIGAIFLFVFYVILNPDLMTAIQTLALKIEMAGDSQEMLMQAVAPYLLKPGVIASILMLLSVIVPLIEEAVKPAAVWLLAGKKLTPSQGFAFGVISGSGFALYENLAISMTGEMWATVMIARVGTALLHILTTGLMGWALASAFGSRRYLRLGITYLTAVLIHGVWNGIALLWGIWQFDLSGPFQGGFVGQLVALAPYGLGLLVVVMFLTLLFLSYQLRNTEPILRNVDGTDFTAD